MSGLVSAPGVRAFESYAPMRHRAPCDIDLAGSAIGEARYPDATPLTAMLAQRFGIDANRVLVTAGADDALDRACRAVLAPGRVAVLTRPTFEMLPRYAALAGATVREVPWPRGEFPTDAVIADAESAALVAIVSPNNPTGAVATFDDLRRVHDGAPSALVLLDLAYVEFAGCDPTAAALELPRVVVVRTLSKAWQMPGIRVGCAIGSPEVIGWMRRAGGPYPVAAPSLAAAEAALRSDAAARNGATDRVKRNRERLTRILCDLGAAPLPSEANFVTVDGARWLHDALAGLGIATRWLPADGGRVRITIPPDDATFARLERGVRIALDPEALLFDMDGVLADVSLSYREAIRLTAAKFGVTVTAEAMRARKLAGHANDDWALTEGLIADGGGTASLEDVTREFERVYQGANGDAGLKARERLLVSPDWLMAMAARFPLAIVTGRPRADAEEFLQRFGIRGAFRAVVAREDGPVKPDAFPVAHALRMLGVGRAWMIGDTPDDVTSARAAGVLPVGVLAPGETRELSAEALERAGAARVLTQTTEIDACLS